MRMSSKEANVIAAMLGTLDSYERTGHRNLTLVAVHGRDGMAGTLERHPGGWSWVPAEDAASGHEDGS